MPNPYGLTLAQAENCIRNGELSSVALAESLLNRIQRLDPALKAWVTIDRDDVLSQAADRDQELRGKGPRGPLHGIPIGLKDIIYTAGMKTTAGSKVYADFVPDYDATSVTRLKEAGAIILGKAVTTEFANADPSRTQNPWNAAHTPGGSSSGPAVAVASRMCPGALGSQTAGSVCRPASYNGVVGLKPTYGRISAHGVIPLAWSFDTVGVITRTVEDSAILLSVLAWHDANDPSSAPEPVPDYRASLSDLSSAPIIGLVRQFFLEECDADVAKNAEEAAQRLAVAGARVQEVSLPDSFSNCIAAHRVIMNVECASFHEELFKERRAEYGPVLTGTIETGMVTPAVRYVEAQRLRRRFKDDMSNLAGEVDVLLTPTASAPAPRDLNTTGDMSFQSPWTFVGLPTISIPSGLSSTGLPLGLQLIGRPFDESRLLAVARWCEETLGVELTPPEPA